MRARAALLTVAVMLGASAPAAAQEQVRISVNAGQQATGTAFTEEQTFQEYFEQGSFTLARAIARRPFYDAGIAVRLTGGWHAGGTFSFFSDAGAGQVTGQVPHPFFFNQRRAVSGDVQSVTRREGAAHLQLSYTVPTAGGLEFSFLGGPSIFMTEQAFVTRLNVALDREVYPYDSLVFPGASTDTLKENAFGYNAGVDLTWRFAQHVGAGLLIRYSRATKDFTPPGGQPVTIETGGLHAGGGLRLLF